MARNPLSHNAPGRHGSALVRASAYLSILVERIWPTVLGLAGLAALFFILAWFGTFALAPGWARLGLLAVLAAGVAAVLWRGRGVRLPAGAEVARRIEAASRLKHQPLQAQGDRATAADPFAQALWREHQARMAERLRNLRGGAPETRTYALDPWGMRALLAVLFVTAFAYSYGPGGGRVADALTAVEGKLPAGVRVDAWATPPGYTGRAPIFLTDAAGGPVPAGRIEVPEGTVLSLRISDRSGTTVTFAPEGGQPAEVVPIDPVAPADGVPAATPAESAAPPTTAPAGPVPGEYELTLAAPGAVSVATSFRSLNNWTFAVTPDDAPTIALEGTPKPGRNGGLDIAYLVTDDYGAAGGQAQIAVRESLAPGARALVAPPEVNLAMPRRTKGEVKGRTSVDLAESPYAGAKVAITLTARDDAGQVGESAPLELTLPERRFVDPLAKAVVEQRRILALDANAAPRVVDMLDAVTLRGDEFIPNASDYLALRAARERIAAADGDEALLSSVDFLWQIALGIEDGDLSLSEKRLRDAQENLSEALKNGATDEEIAKLMQELRAAMQEYMQAMAEALRNMPPQSQSQMGQMQEIRPQDLERMMDKIEDLARSGSKDAAQQLLSELKEMMNSLQAMRPGQGQQQQSGQPNPMQEQMNQLGEMLQRQQKLMDETFEMGRQQMRRQMEAERGTQESQEGQQGQPQQGQQPPMTEEQLQALKERLQAEQGQLQKDLQALQEAMEGQGLKPSDDLGQAGQSMGRAEGALGQGNDGEAVGQQGKAMDALRRGAQDAMQQMQAMQGQGQQPGTGQQPGQGQLGEGYGPGQQRSGRDPLGRERQTQGPDFGQDIDVPDEIDIQRARRILDQIRDKLGHRLSPQQERDYLERLLKTP